MQTPTPQIVTTLTRVVGCLYVALGTLTTASVVTELPREVTVVLALLIAVVGAVQAGLKSYAADRTTSTDAVLEVREGDAVVAGPANELVPTGAVVRRLG